MSHILVIFLHHTISNDEWIITLQPTNTLITMDIIYYLLSTCSHGKNASSIIDLSFRREVLVTSSYLIQKNCEKMSNNEPFSRPWSFWSMAITLNGQHCQWMLMSFGSTGPWEKEAKEGVVNAPWWIYFVPYIFTPKSALYPNWTGSVLNWSHWPCPRQPPCVWSFSN